MAKIKKRVTMCGSQITRRDLGGGRAVVIARDGNKLTYRWPCGYERTEVFTQGVGRLKKPASPEMVAFFARYWSQGVNYECPRCRRLAISEARKKKTT